MGVREEMVELRKHIESWCECGKPRRHEGPCKYSVRPESPTTPPSGPAPEPPPGPPPVASQVIDLMEALKASLAKPKE